MHMFKSSRYFGFALIVVAGVASSMPAQAQFNFNPMQMIGSGGRVNPGAAFGVGIGAIQEISRQQQAAEGRRQRAIAAEEARQRRIAMSQSKAGRAQLAREDRAARQRERAQQQFILGIAGAMLSGGGGGDSSDYRQSRQDQMEKTLRMQRQQERDMRQYHNSPY